MGYFCWNQIFGFPKKLNLENYRQKYLSGVHYMFLDSCIVHSFGRPPSKHIYLIMDDIMVLHVILVRAK